MVSADPSAERSGLNVAGVGQIPMKTSRRRGRRPDANLGQTIQNLRSQMDFKRMLVFSLRSVSEMVAVSNKQNEDNSYCAIEQGIIKDLTTIQEKYKTDAEIVTLIASALEGILYAFVTQPDTDTISAAGDQGFSEVVTSVLLQYLEVVSESGNAPAWNTLRQVFDQLYACKMTPVSPDVVFPPVMEGLQRKGLTPPMGSALCAVAGSLLGHPLGPAKLAGSDIVDLILSAADTVLQSSNNKQQMEFVNHAISYATSIVEATEYKSETAAESARRLMDKIATSGSRVSEEAAGRLLGKLLGPEEIRRTLTMLNQGGDKAVEALSLLTALSYAKGMENIWTKEGGLAPLCRVVKDAAGKLDVHDEKQVRGLMSACAMLSALALSHSTDLAKMGCVDALIAICEKVKGKDHGDLLSKVYQVCSSLAQAEPSTIPTMVSSNAVLTSLIDAVNLPMTGSTKVVRQNATQLIGALAANSGGARALGNQGVDKAIAKMLESTTLKNEVVLVRGAFNAFLGLAAVVPPAQTRTWIPGIAAGMNSLTAEDANAAELAVKLLAKLCESLDESLKKAIVDAKMTEALLKLTLTFRDNALITQHAERILAVAAQESALEEAVKSLGTYTHDAKKDAPKVLLALATINGLYDMDHFSTKVKAGCQPAVMKAADRVGAMPPFPEQKEIMQGILSCISNIQTKNPALTGSVASQLLAVAAQAPMKKIIQAEGDPEDNSLNALLVCVGDVVKGDAFEDKEAAAKIMEQLCSVMRKYNEFKKAQQLSMQLLNDVINCTSVNCVDNFTDSGAAKQVLSYLQRATHHEETQKVGLKLILTCAQKSQHCLESLRSSGAKEVAIAAGRTYQGKPEIARLHAQLLALLTPTEQIKIEVTENINNLNVAARNRDVMNGRDALANLARLTVAAEAARHASKEQVGDSVNAFFEALQSAKVDPAEMDMCSAGAVGILRNVAAVGKPHSSLLLKKGALNLLRAIVQEASEHPERPQSAELLAAALEAGRCLLSHEKNPAYASGAQDFGRYLHALLPEAVSHKPDLMMPIMATLGLVSSGKMLEDAAFVSGLDKMPQMLSGGKKPEDRQRMLSCVHQMFMTVDPDVAHKLALMFAERGGIEAIVSMLEIYGKEEPATARVARKALDRICVVCGDCTELRNIIVKRGGMAAVRRTCQAVGRNLGTSREDSDSAVAGLKFLTAITTKMNKTDLAQTGLLELIEDLITASAKGGSSSTPLPSVIGELLENFGAEEWLTTYFKRVVELMSTRPASLKTDLIEVLKKLETFIPCEVSNIDAAFKDAPKAMDCLAQYLPEVKSDQQMLPQVSAVIAKLCQRFESQPDVPYGAKAMVPKVMPTLVDMIHGKDPSVFVRSCRPFLRDVFTVFDLLCVNKVTFESFKPVVIKNGILVDAWEVFERHAKDPAVELAIIKFLSHFATDEEAVRLIEEAQKQTKVRELGKDAESAIFEVIWGLRRSPSMVAEGLEAIGEIVGKKSKKSGLFTEENVKKILELAESTPDGAVGYAALARNVAASERRDATGNMAEDALDNLVRQYKKIKDDPEVPEEVKNDLLDQLTGMSAALITKGVWQPLARNAIPSVLGEALRQRQLKKESVAKIIEAVRPMTDRDDLKTAMLTQFIPAMVGEASPILQEDPRCAQLGLELVKKMIDDNGENADFLKDVNGMFETIEAVRQLAVDQLPPAREKLESLVRGLLQALNSAVPTPLTLEEVFNRWTRRIAQGELLDIAENPAIHSEYDFAFDQTEEYSKEPHKNIDDFISREFSFGCMNFGLLHEIPDNVLSLVKRGNQHWFMKAMDSIEIQELIQYVVQGNVQALHVKEGVQAWSEVPDARTITIKMVKGGNKWELEVSRKETFLIKRLEFMEKLSPTRAFYDHTEALTALHDLWQKVETGVHSIALLKAIVKVLRVIVNETWTDELIKYQISELLLERVEGHHSPYDLLTDVLFCLGNMASVLRLKNIIGELEGIEKIVDLLKRCDKVARKNGYNADLSRTQQNACLALGNLVLGHGLNANAFGNSNGIDLVIRVMQSSMMSRVDYDLSNAASVCMCNVCFQRDDFKEALGKRGAPQAILLTIQNYDGLESESAFRCLTSMFKAVTNLALIPANVQRFLDNGISDSLRVFYTNAAAVPDEVIFQSLKTMANLTLENLDTFMAEFGKLTPPLLRLLEGRDAYEPLMLAFLFETFASLCRYPENRETFIQNRGIEILLRILNSMKHEKVYEEGLNLMSVLVPNAADQLVSYGAYTLALQIMEDCEELSADLLLGALKLVRRLVKETPGAFVEMSPCPLLTDVLCAAAVYANKDSASALVTCEVLRIILTLLHLHPAPFAGERDVTSEVIATPSDPSWKAILARDTSSRSRSFSRMFASQSEQFSTDFQRTRADSQAQAESPTTTETPVTPFTGDDSDRRPERRDGRSGGKNSARRSQDDTDSRDDEGSPVLLDTPVIDVPINTGSVLYKPKGPRSWEKAGFDAVNMGRIAQALFVLIASQEVLRLEKLTEFAVVFLAFVVTEKIDGIAAAFVEEPADIAAFVKRVFGRMKEDYGELKKRIVFEGTEFLGSLLCLVAHDEIVMLSQDEEAIESLKSCSAHLHPKKDADLRRKVDEIYALLHSDPNDLVPSLFYPLTTYDFPLTHADFKSEPYPNGVQDLEPTLRKKIRKGNRCSIVIVGENGEADLETCFWRSSTDLKSLCYMTDRKMQNYDFKIPMSRVRKIERGLHGSPLVRKYAKDLRLRSHSTVSLVVSPCPQWPNGGDFVFAFVTRFHCRKFFDKVREWQAAATV